MLYVAAFQLPGYVNSPSTRLWNAPSGGFAATASRELCGANLLRFDDRDVLVAPEVLDIEGLELGDVVGFHGSDEPSIMSLATDDGIPCDELSPFVIGGEVIWQEVKVPLNHPNSPLYFGRGEAEATAGGRRARRDPPKFGEDLRRIAERFPSSAECLKRVQGD